MILWSHSKYKRSYIMLYILYLKLEDPYFSFSWTCKFGMGIVLWCKQYQCPNSTQLTCKRTYLMHLRHRLHMTISFRSFSGAVGCLVQTKVSKNGQCRSGKRRGAKNRNLLFFNQVSHCFLHHVNAYPCIHVWCAMWTTKYASGHADIH